MIARRVHVPTYGLPAVAGEPLPVHGAGQNVRDGIDVTDHGAAIRAVLDGGRLGETYLVGGPTGGEILR